jgi:hypothetical protein
MPFAGSRKGPGSGSRSPAPAVVVTHAGGGVIGPSAGTSRCGLRRCRTAARTQASRLIPSRRPTASPNAAAAIGTAPARNTNGCTTVATAVHAEYSRRPATVRMTNCRPVKPNASLSAFSMSPGTRARSGASSVRRFISDHLVGGDGAARAGTAVGTAGRVAGTERPSGTILVSGAGTAGTAPPRGPLPGTAGGTVGPVAVPSGTAMGTVPLSAGRPGTAGWGACRCRVSGPRLPDRRAAYSPPGPGVASGRLAGRPWAGSPGTPHDAAHLLPGQSRRWRTPA